MFSFGKKKPGTKTKVWKTREACLKGMAYECLQAIRRNEPSVIISFFEASHREAELFMNSNDVPFDMLTSFSGADAVNSAKVIHLIDAQSLLPVALSGKAKMNFHLFGHYPYLPAETKFIEQLTERFPSSNICFCLSLADPLFEFFGAERLVSLMTTLGMKDDECIEHSMVDAAVHNALKKIEKEVPSETRARSEKDWFTRNINKKLIQ